MKRCCKKRYKKLVRIYGEPIMTFSCPECKDNHIIKDVEKELEED